MKIDWQIIWQILFFTNLIFAIITIIPIVWAFLKKVKLNKVAEWFGKADVFKEQKERLITHELRIEGTLVYWKNKAVAHNRLNAARIIWSIFSAVTLPVLIQFYDKANNWSVAFLTGLTVFTGLIVSIAHALKSEQMHRGFRDCESDYYDLARALLDNPEDTPEKRKIQVDDFLQVVEKIRKAGRKVETGRPPSGLKDP